MASHVVVIDSTARRAMVKVTPSKPLSDVLEEACKKLGVNASQYGLKHNNKQVDLSRSIRLSGLSSGAKLELVQLSKSPSVVSVAIKLPESEAHGVPNGRLADKFPSTTTLWQILRRFEAGVAGGGDIKGRNLTARSVPVTENGGSGAGSLFYEQPAINIMGRELSTFADLQKTLGQLGFNSGSALLRLNFKTTETPMHEAMAQIEEYFKSLGEDTPRPPQPAEPLREASPAAETMSAQESAPQAPSGGDTPMTDAVPTSTTSSPPVEAPDTAIEPSSVSSRPVQIFSPPTSSTPSAALASSYNETDYVPTVEHAQVHQRLLQQSSRNTRLPTDSELQAQAQAARERLASISSVEIKIRFPDQSSVVATFGQSDTGSSLYSFVRDCLDPNLQTEPFLLRYPSPTTGGRGQATVPESSDPSPSPSPKLIQELELRGRVLMTFTWDPERASPEARMKRQVLKPELTNQAKQIEVVDVGKTMPNADDGDKGVKVDLKGTDEKKGGDGGGAGGKKVPKWLKLPGKK